MVYDNPASVRNIPNGKRWETRLHSKLPSSVGKPIANQPCMYWTLPPFLSHPFRHCKGSTVC